MVDRNGRRQSAWTRVRGDSDRRIAHVASRRGSCFPEYLAPKAPRRIPPEPQQGRARGRSDRVRRAGRSSSPAAVRWAIRHQFTRFLDASGALYLDTEESRGLVPGTHPSFVGAVRARVNEGSRPRRRDRSQARLPDRLRLADGVSERALDPHRRQRGGAAGEPARGSGAVCTSRSGARSDDRELCPRGVR